jgi:hypothetical protein
MAYRGCGMCNGGFESGLQTFRRREEVVAVAPPTGESNPVASGWFGGEAPAVSVSEELARFSHKAPSAKGGRIGSTRAGMVHGTHRLRSGVETRVEAVLSTCSDMDSTTSSVPQACAKRLDKRHQVWIPRTTQNRVAGRGEGLDEVLPSRVGSTVATARRRSPVQAFPSRLQGELLKGAARRTCPNTWESRD